MQRAFWMAAAGGAALAALLLAERVRPLRAGSRAPSFAPRRLTGNAALGALSMIVVEAIERPLSDRLARRVAHGRLGLAQPLPAPLRAPAAFLLADWMNHWWHVLTHREPLWRLHLVHHSDHAMDASTALRFHAADMLLGVAFRLAQVRLAGMGPGALAAWRGWFYACVAFHHSNLRLPAALDRALALVVVTPRLHGIHHMARPDATASNWSSGFSWWDRLHGSNSDELAPDELPTGVPRYRRHVPLGELLALPWRPVRAWESEDGRIADADTTQP